MAIRVQCMCGELIDARERMAGREVRCPRCNRLVLVPGATSQVRPSTVFSLAVLAGILITLGLVLLPEWLEQVGKGGEAQRRICARNLRALHAAIKAYAIAHGGWMPSSWDNTFALIAPYLSPQDRDGPDPVWRCPSDGFRGNDPANHCSYAINADETDGGPDGANQFHSHEGFRQSGHAGGEGAAGFYPGPFAHRVRDGGSRQVGVLFDHLPPNTILMIECWSPLNTLDRDRPDRPNRVGPGPGERCCLAIREYRVWRKPDFDSGGYLRDAGSYLFLKPFEGKPLKQMYHGGRLHVLYQSGDVELVPIERLLEPSPKGLAPGDLLRGFLEGTPWTRPGERGGRSP